MLFVHDCFFLNSNVIIIPLNKFTHYFITRTSITWVFNCYQFIVRVTGFPACVTQSGREPVLTVLTVRLPVTIKPILVVPRGIEPRSPAFHTGAYNPICQSTIHTADEKRFELLTFALTGHCSAIELFIHCWPGETRTHNPRGKSPLLWSNWATNQYLFVGPARLELATLCVWDTYSSIELRTNNHFRWPDQIPCLRDAVRQGTDNLVRIRYLL